MLDRIVTILGFKTDIENAQPDVPKRPTPDARIGAESIFFLQTSLSPKITCDPHWHVRDSVRPVPRI